MSGHAHNPGKLKQKNKKHKAPAKGKRFQKKMQGGKVQTSSGSGKAGRGERPTVVKRADRINQQVQARRNKIMEAQLAKRLGSNQGPPRIVALVPLTNITSSGEILSYITETNPSLTGVASLRRDESSNVTYTQYSNFKGNCIFVEARNRDANEYLEVCKMADIVLFVTRESIDPDINMVDDIGAETLLLLRSLGTPEAGCVILTTDGIDVGSISASNSAASAAGEAIAPFELDDKEAKKDKDVKAKLHKYLGTELSPDIKLFDLRYIECGSGTVANAAQSQLITLIRFLCNSSIRPLVYRSMRSYLLSEICDMDDMPETAPKANGNRMIAVRGYLRGKPLLVDSLMYISGAGACRLVRVEQSADPFNRKDATGAAMDADESNQESLEIEATPDVLQGEQTWPTEEELGEVANVQPAVSGRERLLNGQNLPKGMSSYQADWFVDDDGKWTGDNDDDEAAVGSGNVESSALANAADDDEDDAMLMDDDVIADTSSKPRRVQFADDAMAGDNRENRGEELEDLQFPDEVETPTDTSCRQRFSRYRCLQSFRSSPWDPMENLPEVYSRIFHIENFPGIVKKGGDELNFVEKKFNTFEKSMDKSEEFFGDAGYVKAGQYVTLYLECDANTYNSFVQLKQGLGYCTTFSLLKYENKLSVLHFTIQRDNNYEGIIKNKDELYFHTGFRSFNARPIFSEPNLNCDKHKMDRFLHPNRFTVASCIGPVTYAPTPVIVYKKIESVNADGSISNYFQIVASGTLTSVDPNRIVLKKVILTGVPLRTHKRSAVIKHLFYDPLDVPYYKPAELVTKLGLRGSIRCPVGTHGLFKASFDNPIKQNDTIMLIMYKRCFPKLPENGIEIK